MSSGPSLDVAPAVPVFASYPFNAHSVQPAPTLTLRRDGARQRRRANAGVRCQCRPAPIADRPNSPDHLRSPVPGLTVKRSPRSSHRDLLHRRSSRPLTGPQ